MAGNSKSSIPTRRLYIFAGVMLLWVGLIALRLVDLQIVRYGDFQHQAARQQQRTFDVSPSRGVVYDRNGHELAMSVNVWSAFAVPSEVPNLDEALGIVARVAPFDTTDVMAHCKAQRAFCWVARKLDPDTADRVRALNLKGVYFLKEPRRFYPKRELAAQVLGYAGIDGDGLSGVEREFDDKLRGVPGRMVLQRDAKGHSFGSVEQQPQPGENVVLTIDEKIQFIAERELETAMRQTHALSGTVIVENPSTGEILALANRPDFNPNDPRSITPERLKNHAVSDIFEPGSTFKIVTVAGALEERLTRPEEVIDCQMGAIIVGGMRIRDHKAYGDLTVEQIIANSSDVGAIKLGLRLGEKRFDQYIRAFGFGSQTGIELPGETRGMTKPVSRWSKVSIGAISMGQEIGISAVQLAGLISTIANDGNYAPPRLVMSSGPGVGTAGVANVAYHPAPGRRVISAETSDQMKHMLQAVVLHGTGPKAQLDGYSAAGKTGTAQRADPATGAYSKTKYVASFAGFAPIANPAIVVAVILDAPVGLHEGGQVAAPVFQRVTQQVLAYLNVPHDLDLKSTNGRRMMAAVHDEDLNDSSPDRLGGVEADEPSPIQAQLAQPARVEEPAPAKEAVKPALTPVVLKTKPPAASLAPQQRPAPPPPTPDPGTGTVILSMEGGVEVPSFLGLPVRSAVERAQQQGLEIDVQGSGVAREQNPAPGGHVSPGAHIAVRFGR